MTDSMRRNRFAGMKAPMVLRAEPDAAWYGPTVFWREGRVCLIVSERRKGAGAGRLVRTESEDMRRWSALEPVTEEAGYACPGSGAYFRGSYRFCCRMEDGGLCVMRSADLKEFEREPFAGLLAGEGIGVPALAVDPAEPERLWCLYLTDGYLNSAWTSDLRSWREGGSWPLGGSCQEGGTGQVSAVSAFWMDGSLVVALAGGDGLSLFEHHIRRELVTDSEGNVAEAGEIRLTDGKLLGDGAPILTRAQRPSPAAVLSGSGTFLYDPGLGMHLWFYCAGKTETPAEIGVAASRDGQHWQCFRRDQPTYPENGVVYEGDYYRAVPFGAYLSKQPLPAGKPVFDIRDYGAVGDGVTLCTEAFAAAAQAAACAGGGIVLVTDGHYCTGTVRLGSHTTLWIDMDAAVCASKDLSRYEDALLACVDAEDVRVTGGGKIIGNGEYFAYLPLKRPLTEPMETTKLPPILYDPMGYPVDTIRYAYRSRIRYAEDRYGDGLPVIPRPMYTVWIRGCCNVTLKNIVIESALDWTLVLDLSREICVKDVVIHGNRHIANTDGIDIMGCSGVEIRHCFISCADDGLCVKSPRKQGHDGIQVSDPTVRMEGTRDVHISDCTVMSVMNAFKIGTETYFDIENITVENCHFQMPDLYPGSVSGISIESADGSHIRNVQVRNIRMDRVCCPVFICLNRRNKYGYENAQDEKSRRYGGSIREIRIEDVEADQMEVPCIITGYEEEADGVRIERKVEDVHIRGFRAVYRDNREELSLADRVVENITDYPESNAFGDVPAYGFYIRHGENICLEQIEVTPRSCNRRACIVRESATGTDA